MSFVAAHESALWHKADLLRRPRTCPLSEQSGLSAAAFSLFR